MPTNPDSIRSNSIHIHWWIQWRIQGGGGAGGPRPPPPPPPPPTHTHTHDTKKILNLYCWPCLHWMFRHWETAISWSRSGFAIKAINSTNAINLWGNTNTPCVKPCLTLCFSYSFPPPNLAYPLIHQSGHGQGWNCRMCTYLTSAPPPFNSWIRPWDWNPLRYWKWIETGLELRCKRG